MNYKGDYALGKTVYHYFVTNNAAGAATAPLSGFEAADFKIYKNGSTTERSSTAGVTVTSAFDGSTAVHMIAIDCSDNTDAGYYGAANDYQIILKPDTETVDGQTIEAATHCFSILNRAQMFDYTTLPVGPIPQLGVLDNGTAQSASSTGIVGRAAAAFADNALIGATLAVYGSTQGYWQTRSITANALSGDAYTVDAWDVTPSGTITYFIFAAPPASASSLPGVNVVNWKGSAAPNMTGDAYARLGAPAGASIAADIAAAFARLGAPAGASIAADLATIAGYIDTEVAAIKAKTDNLPSDPADASDIAASFSSISGTLTTIAGYIDTEVAAIKAKTDNLPASPAAVGSAMTLATDSVNAAALAADAVTEIVVGVFARAFSAAYGSYTFDELVKLFAAVLLGKASGLAGTTATYRNLADSGNVVVATVDADGNRTAVTRTP